MMAMTIFVIIPLALNPEREPCLRCVSNGVLISFFRDNSEGKRVKRVCEFWDERYGKNRSITDIDWSPKASAIDHLV
jgi:hypothetical protein